MSAQTIELAAPATSTAVEAALPSGYVIGQALSVDEAHALTENIHTAMGIAQELLRVAFRGRAHEALGFGRGLAGWEAYFNAHFAGYVVALPAEQRRAQVKAWMAVGASVRVMGVALDASPATISADRKALGGPTAQVHSLDGRNRDAAAASAKAVEAKAASAKKAVTLTQRIEDMVRAAGPAGMTQKEAMPKLRGYHHGQVSAAFTAVKQQRRTHLTGERRDGYGVHVTAEHVVLDAEVVG